MKMWHVVSLIVVVLAVIWASNNVAFVKRITG
jgi:hypothetical protein